MHFEEFTFPIFKTWPDEMTGRNITAIDRAVCLLPFVSLLCLHNLKRIARPSVRQITQKRQAKAVVPEKFSHRSASC
jgi:hypothetical protein